MNKVLKWILISLGIVLAVGLVAMVALRGFGFHPYWMASRWHSLGYGMGGMMAGMGLFMLLRFAFYLAVIGFAIYGLVMLIKHSRRETVVSVPANVAATPAERTCVKCSKPLQSDWVNCPYCGKKQ